MIETTGDIIKEGLCVGCGMCTKPSSKMVLNSYGFLEPSSWDDNSSCPILPPKKENSNQVLAELFLKSDQSRPYLGNYIGTYAGYSNEFRATSSSGGVGTWVCNELLRRGLVDKIYAVKDVNGHYEYGWVSDYREILSLSKTRYFPVSASDFFKEIEDSDLRVAIVGVGCFIRAVRLKQKSNSLIRNRVVFTVGIICGGLKSKGYTDFLAHASGIDGKYVNQEYRLKGESGNALNYSFGAREDASGAFKKVQMNRLGDMWGSGLFKSKACDVCQDVTTELADISLGDAWIQPFLSDTKGNNIIVTRSSLAETLIKDGLKSNQLNLDSIKYQSVLNSQSGSITHRIKSTNFRLKFHRRLFQFKNLEKNGLHIEEKMLQVSRMVTMKLSHVVWLKISNKTIAKKIIISMLKYHGVVTRIRGRIKRLRKTQEF